ncbi:unnamed protein product [Amoebophrya sp. A120]|nr:unnamed protein product [Amoebophrya sp. A120]|eukprot:GSA120T00014442001.1
MKNVVSKHLPFTKRHLSQIHFTRKLPKNSIYQDDSEGENMAFVHYLLNKKEEQDNEVCTKPVVQMVLQNFSKNFTKLLRNLMKETVVQSFGEQVLGSLRRRTAGEGGRAQDHDDQEPVAGGAAAAAQVKQETDILLTSSSESTADSSNSSSDAQDSTQQAVAGYRNSPLQQQQQQQQLSMAEKLEKDVLRVLKLKNRQYSNYLAAENKNGGSYAHGKIINGAHMLSGFGWNGAISKSDRNTNNYTSAEYNVSPGGAAGGGTSATTGAASSNAFVLPVASNSAGGTAPSALQQSRGGPRGSPSNRAEEDMTELDFILRKNVTTADLSFRFASTTRAFVMRIPIRSVLDLVVVRHL